MVFHVLKAFGLVIALSIDGFVLGKAYSSQSPRVRIPFGAYVVIALCTALLMSFPALFGYFGYKRFPDQVSRFLGGGILIWLGLSHIWYKRRRSPSDGQSNNGLIFNLRISSIGIIVQILKDPLSADRDLSGHIDMKEAIALGLALGLDSFGAGFALSFMEFSFWIVPAIGVASALFVWMGARISFPGNGVIDTPYMPGILLLLLGLSRILF